MYLTPIQLLIIVLTVKFPTSQSLKSLLISVPEYAKVNDTVTLACDYDLENVALYTIKWYWNGIEFYRFVPKESPPSKAFDIANYQFNVDISESGANEVTLLNVQKELSGLFKCEVSADAPLFHTELKGAVMNVVDVPNCAPRLEVPLKSVDVGKRIKATCSLNTTNTAANLTWYINDQIVIQSDSHVVMKPTRMVGNRMQSRIEIIALRSLFNGGQIKLKCECNFYNIWSMSVDDTISEEVHYLAPILFSTSPQTQDDEQFDFFGSSSITRPNTLIIVAMIVIFNHFACVAIR